jgi:predicted Zn-dependent peptidase
MAGLVGDAMEDAWRMRASDEAILSPRIFKVEHAAVTHETAENNEWPGMIGFREARKLLYRSNPARFEGDSEPEQFANIKLGTVKQWTQQHLVAETLRIIVLGPTRDAAVRLLRGTELNNLPARTAVKPVFDASDLVPSLTGIVRREYPRAGSRMRHVCMLWPTDVEGCRYSLPLEVLARVLKDRVEEALREEAMGVYHPHVDWDRTSTHAGCEDMVQRTLHVIEALKRDGSDAFVEDVDDSRFYLANSYLEDYHYTPGAFADRILDALSNGDGALENFNAYYSDMLHVSPARVRAAARKYLPTDRFVITTVRPAE